MAKLKKPLKPEQQAEDMLKLLNSVEITETTLQKIITILENLPKAKPSHWNCDENLVKE